MTADNPTGKQPDPIMQILENLKGRINANPETSNYIFREDDDAFTEAHQQLQAYFDTEIRDSLATYEKELLIDYDADKAEAVRLGKIEELEKLQIDSVGYDGDSRYSMHAFYIVEKRDIEARIAKLKEEL